MYGSSNFILSGLVHQLGRVRPAKWSEYPVVTNKVGGAILEVWQQ